MEGNFVSIFRHANMQLAHALQHYFFIKEDVSRESLAVSEDCLKLLFLIHTLAQARECQRHITVLLLEALYLVFSQCSGCHSQVLHDLIPEPSNIYFT